MCHKSQTKKVFVKNKYGDEQSDEISNVEVSCVQDETYSGVSWIFFFSTIFEISRVFEGGKRDECNPHEVQPRESSRVLIDASSLVLSMLSSPHLTIDLPSSSSSPPHAQQIVLNYHMLGILLTFELQGKHVRRR